MIDSLRQLQKWLVVRERFLWEFLTGLTMVVENMFTGAVACLSVVCRY